MPYKVPFLGGPEVPTDEEFQNLVKIVDENDKSILGSIEKVNEKIEEINGKIGNVDFEKVKNLQELNVEDLRNSLADRAEYRDLWEAQKQEATALETLRANKGDPEIQALLSMKGLEVMVSRDEIAKLQGTKEQLKEALKKFPDSRGGRYARMLANLGYAYVLMAQHYKVAREHVTAVISEKTLTDVLFTVAIEALKAAVQAGLSALTQGVSGIVTDKLLGAAKLAPDSSDYQLMDTKGETHTVTLNTKVDDQGAEIGRSMGEGVVTAPLESTRDQMLGGLGSLSGQIGGLGGLVTRATQLFSTDTPENTTQDPYDFFIDKEAQLRRATAFVASCTDPNILSEIKVQLDQEYSLEDLENNPYWKPFFEVHENYDDLNAIWEQVSALLASNMRRLCWRLFCRSQWNNVKYSYTITVVDPSSKDFPRNQEKETDAPATDWNYKVWTWSGLGWPRHWEKICSDFKGPEHDPDHKFTVTKGLVNRAHKLLESNGWISLAVVECCQVKRYDSRTFGHHWAIDLEKYGHVGGEEDGDAGPISVPHGWTDWDLVFGDVKDRKYANSRDLSTSYLETFLQKIRVHSGMRVQIAEIRFGKGGEDVVGWTKATGKKGRLSEANSSESAIPVAKGMKITTLIQRTDAHGNATTSTKHAYVHLYKADGDKHSDNTRCALVDKKQLCWYCAFSSDEEVASEKFKEYYRLKRVDQGRQVSRVISNVEVAYVNFPTSSSLNYISEPGLYCIRLHPRRDLQSMDGQFHMTDTWWFRILDKGGSDQAPQVPTINGPLKRGAKKVAGTYARRASDDAATTLIHVFINGKMYGPKEIPHPADTNPVDWEIDGIDELRGGEKIHATATWPASGTEGARQSDEPSQAVLVPAEAPRLNGQRLYAGATWASGFSNAAPGSIIRLYVEDTVPSTIEEDTKFAGQTKLAGKIEDVAEVKSGTTVIVPEMKGVIRWQVNEIEALVENQEVVAKVFAYGKPASAEASDTQTVKLAPKPVITSAPKPGDTELSGTAENVGALHMRLEVDGTPTVFEDIAGVANDSGSLSWSLGATEPLAPFEPGQKLVMEAGLNQRTGSKSSNWIACSEKSDEITIEKFEVKPTVHDVTLGAAIEVDVDVPDTLIDRCEVRVGKENDSSNWKVATRVPDTKKWKLENPPLFTPGTDKIVAQVFGKPQKKKSVGAEFSELSVAADVGKADAPTVDEPSADATSVSGKFKYQPNCRVLVKIGDEIMQHPAEFNSRNATPGTETNWRLTKLKAKGSRWGSRVALTAGKKVKAAICVGEKEISDWGEAEVS